MSLSVCIPDHLLWCVSGGDVFGFHTTNTTNATGEAWVNRHLHAYFSGMRCSKGKKMGPIALGRHPTPIRREWANKQSLSATVAVGDTFTSSSIRWELFHCVQPADHGYKSDEMVHFNYSVLICVCVCGGGGGGFCWGQQWTFSPGVEEICSEALKRQIKGIKPVQSRVLNQQFPMRLGRSHLFLFTHKQQFKTCGR